MENTFSVKKNSNIAPTQLVYLIVTANQLLIKMTHSNGHEVIEHQYRYQRHSSYVIAEIIN